MSVNKKLIITDLDGTLLNSKGELSKYTIESVKKIINAGHIFCISTGRPLRSAMRFYKILELDTIISTLNGGVISNPSNHDYKEISFTFDKQVLLKILNNPKVKEHTKYIIIENIKTTFLISKKNNIKINKKFLNIFHIDVKELIHLNEIEELESLTALINPISVLISVAKEYIDEVAFSIKSLLNTFILRVWTDSTDNSLIIEINTLFSNKGNSMKYLSCFYGVSLSNVYTFGDGENDIKMIQSLPNAFAMKNAIPSIKLISYKITEKNNNEDGVVKELLKELKI